VLPAKIALTAISSSIRRGDALFALNYRGNAVKIKNRLNDNFARQTRRLAPVLATIARCVLHDERDGKNQNTPNRFHSFRAPDNLVAKRLSAILKPRAIAFLPRAEAG
jgi:hypothetical protein